MRENPLSTLLDEEDAEIRALEIAIFSNGTDFYLEVDKRFPKTKGMEFDLWL